MMTENYFLSFLCSQHLESISIANNAYCKTESREIRRKEEVDRIEKQQWRRKRQKEGREEVKNKNERMNKSLIFLSHIWKQSYNYLPFYFHCLRLFVLISHSFPHHKNVHPSILEVQEVKIFLFFFSFLG